MEDKDEPLIQRNIRFPESTWERVGKVAKSKGVSKFVRDAVDKALAEEQIGELQDRVEAVETELTDLRARLAALEARRG